MNTAFGILISKVLPEGSGCDCWRDEERCFIADGFGVAVDGGEDRVYGREGSGWKGQFAGRGF